jgi:hypothetical protein
MGFLREIRGLWFVGNWKRIGGFWAVWVRRIGEWRSGFCLWGSVRFIFGFGMLRHEKFLRFFEEETECCRLFFSCWRESSWAVLGFGGLSETESNVSVQKSLVVPVLKVFSHIDASGVNWVKLTDFSNLRPFQTFGQLYCIMILFVFLTVFFYILKYIFFYF